MSLDKLRELTEAVARGAIITGAEERMAHAARDLLIESLRLHTITCRDSDGSCEQRASLLAWLAHSIGVGPAEMRKLPKLLVEYDLACEGSGCSVHKKADAAATKTEEGPNDGEV